MRNETLYPSLEISGMEIWHGKEFFTLGYLLITEKLILTVELPSGKHHRSSFRGIWSLAVCPVHLLCFKGWEQRSPKPFPSFRSTLSLKLLS